MPARGAVYCPSCWSHSAVDGTLCGRCGFGGHPSDRWLSYSPKGRELAGGKYRFVEPLGAGGFGFTARAVQYHGATPLGSVAVKTLFDSTGDGAKGHFVEEAGRHSRRDSLEPPDSSPPSAAGRFGLGPDRVALALPEVVEAT